MILDLVNPILFLYVPGTHPLFEENVRGISITVKVLNCGGKFKQRPTSPVAKQALKTSFGFAIRVGGAFRSSMLSKILNIEKFNFS